MGIESGRPLRDWKTTRGCTVRRLKGALEKMEVEWTTDGDDEFMSHRGEGRAVLAAAAECVVLVPRGTRLL